MPKLHEYIRILLKISPNVCFQVDGGVAEIMKQPLQLSGPTTIKGEKNRTRDWAALNRAAVQTGATSAKDLTQFRMQHNIWAKEPEHYGRFFLSESHSFDTSLTS